VSGWRGDGGGFARVGKGAVRGGEGTQPRVLVGVKSCVLQF